MYFFSARAKSTFDKVKYPDGVFVVFGKEDTGLSDDILSAYSERTVRIPMRAGVRCLNLSNSAAIAVYEILRQKGYPDLV